MAIAGLTILLRPLNPSAAAIATLLALAWLTWPIWFSPALRGPGAEKLVAWLVAAHPLFAVNGMLHLRLGIWNEFGIAYHLTSLQDEVAYSLPNSVFPCVLLHCGFAAGCGWIARVRIQTEPGGSARVNP